MRVKVTVFTFSLPLTVALIQLHIYAHVDNLRSFNYVGLLNGISVFYSVSIGFSTTTENIQVRG